MVDQLRGRGYLERVASKPCVDDADPPAPELQVLDAATADRLGIGGLWPLRPDDWDEAETTMPDVRSQLLVRLVVETPPYGLGVGLAGGVG